MISNATITTSYTTDTLMTPQTISYCWYADDTAYGQLRLRGQTAWQFTISILLDVYVAATYRRSCSLLSCSLFTIEAYIIPSKLLVTQLLALILARLALIVFRRTRNYSQLCTRARTVQTRSYRGLRDTSKLQEIGDRNDAAPYESIGVSIVALV